MKAWFTRVPIDDGRWAAAVLAVVLIGAVAIAVLERPSDSGGGPAPTPVTSATPGPAAAAGGQIPDVVLHSWQRPLAITPNMDRWGSGFLNVSSGLLDYGPEPGPAASRSEVTAAGADTLEVTATVETRECAIGDIGSYRWSVEGKDTVMNLTAIGADACPTREAALAGRWVRSDLPHAEAVGAILPPGTYLTSAFDPFGAPGVSGQLSYTVPEGWTVEEDPASFVLHHLPNASPGQPSADSFIFVLAQPRVAAELEKGASCGPFGAAPGVGHTVDDIVAAIIARPGVVATPPAGVTIGDHDGQMLDLQVAPSWTGGCSAPEGLIVGIPILVGAPSGTGPSIGIGPDHPVRLILLDLTDGRTMSIAIFSPEPSQASPFEEQVAAVMPIIESFRFHAPGP